MGGLNSKDSGDSLNSEQFSLTDIKHLLGPYLIYKEQIGLVFLVGFFIAFWGGICKHDKVLILHHSHFISSLCWQVLHRMQVNDIMFASSAAHSYERAEKQTDRDDLCTHAPTLNNFYIHTPRFKHITLYILHTYF